MCKSNIGRYLQRLSYALQARYIFFHLDHYCLSLCFILQSRVSSKWLSHIPSALESGASDGVRCLAGDGREVLAGMYGGAVEVWPACKTASSNNSRGEWRRRRIIRRAHNVSFACSTFCGILDTIQKNISTICEIITNQKSLHGKVSAATIAVVTINKNAKNIFP